MSLSQNSARINLTERYISNKLIAATLFNPTRNYPMKKDIKSKPLTKAEKKTLDQLLTRTMNTEPDSFAYTATPVTSAMQHPKGIESATLGVHHTTVEETLSERGDRYGQFYDHSILAQRLQDCIREHNNGEGWNRLPAIMRQALTVDCDKTARILNGDPFYVDNWHDKQGYAKLVEDWLTK